MLSLPAINASGIRVPFALCAAALAISCGLIATAPAAAQGELTDDDLASFYDDEYVSIATGTNQPLHMAPAVATVITAEDMQRLGASSLDDVLERVPGLHVGLSFNRLNSLYSIRGIHTDQNPQVLLLIMVKAFATRFRAAVRRDFDFR